LEEAVYDRTTTRLVEKNCRAYQLFNHSTPAPSQRRGTSTPADARSSATASQDGRDAA